MPINTSQTYRVLVKPLDGTFPSLQLSSRSHHPNRVSLKPFNPYEIAVELIPASDFGGVISDIPVKAREIAKQLGTTLLSEIELICLASQHPESVEGQRLATYIEKELRVCVVSSAGPDEPLVVDLEIDPATLWQHPPIFMAMVMKKK